MKQLSGIMIIAGILVIAPITNAQAQVPIADVIKEGVKKVINAVDLEIQRMQNKTVWLQNAQKQLENILSKSKLEDISGWVEKQKDLYADYFEELWKVKDAIALYHRIKEITGKQLQITREYKTAYNLFKKDSHFTPDEIVYMGKVYSGIIDESLKNVDGLLLVINSFTTQLSDEQRLRMIDAAGDAMDENYNDLQRFNNENKILSLQRSKDAGEAAVVKALYGL